MKKYKLKLKNPSQSFKFDGIVKHDGWCYMLKWLVGDSDMPYSYGQLEKYAKHFTQEEIDSLPHGLVKLHEIIEVEEDRYNIICPITNRYLAYDICKNVYVWIKGSLREDCVLYQRQFTTSELELKLKCYATDYFMVKNQNK